MSLLVTLAGAGMVLRAQQPSTTLIEPPIPLLPRQFLDWQRAGDAALGNDPAQIDSPNAAILKEDGLDRYSTAKYTRDGGTLTATAMQFTDATGAYSAYTLYRAALPKARALAGPEKLGNQSASDAASTVILAGTVVLRVSGEAPTRDLAALTAALPKVGGRRGLQPLLPTYLPTEGLEPATVRYALGPAGYQAMGGVLPPDLLSFQKSAAEAIVGNYTGRGGRGSLTLLLYPTPELAGERGRAIEQDLNTPKAGHETFGTVKMRRVGPLLGITMGSLSAAQAEGLLAALHLNSELTFDKKMPLEFHAEVHKTATLLQNIAAFSGVVGAAAILLGLFLGGARAGIRVLMGKPAATEPEFLTINLREQPKALFLPQHGEHEAK